MSSVSPIASQDPCQWLEQDTPEVLQWQREQDQHARAQLQAGPAFARFDALIRQDDVDMLGFYAPRPVHGRWFQRAVPPGATQVVVSVADVAGEPGRPLFDLAALGLPDAQLQDMQPSPDAQRLLLTVNPNDGTMRTLVFIVEVDENAAQPPREFTLIGPVAAPAWWPDGSGFLYAGLPLGVDPATLPPAPGLRVFEQLLDADLTRRVLPLAHAHSIVMPAVSADGRYAVICEDQTAIHPTWIKCLTPEASGRADGEWQPLLDASYGRVKGSIVDDEYIAITTDAAPRGRLVAIPLATARDRSTWRALLPPGEAVLVSATPVAGKLVIGETHEGNARLRVVWANGTVEHVLPIPAEGAVGKSAFGFVAGLIDDLVWSDGNDIAFVHSSLTQPPVAYRCDVRTGRLSVIGQAAPPLEGITVSTHHAPLPASVDGAGDGTSDGTSDRTDGSVLYRVMRGPDSSGPAPTIVTGYGGFNVHWLPCWSSLAAAWVRAGGTWVHVHLPGGGEFGEAFWRSGRMANKGHGFDALFAVMDDLVQRDLCTPAQLGLFGSSNGSLPVSAAFARRPEAFGAGVAQVPIVDVPGSARDPGTLNIVRSEFGDPLVEEDATWIRAWSPYQHLRAGQRYPALLADAGALDTTCPPWHARKLAAFVRDQGAAGGGPVLLRVREGAGHNLMSRALFIERDAETLAFFAAQLGLPV